MDVIPNNNYTVEELKVIFEDLWNANPNGSKHLYFEKFQEVVIDLKVDPKSIVSKYDSYIAAKADYQRGQYTSNTDRIVDIYDFLQKKMYLQSFAPPVVKNAARDSYLYGIGS